MKWFKQIFSRRRFYGDLSEEIQGHLEEKVEELVGNGMSRRGAESAARREFGNVTLMKEKSRDVWRWSFMETAGIGRNEEFEEEKTHTFSINPHKNFKILFIASSCSSFSALSKLNISTK